MIGGGGAPHQAPADWSVLAGTRWRLAGSVVALLALSNVVVNVWLSSWAYVPWNLAVAAGLLVLARSAGLGWAAIGLDRSTLRRSARWGLIGLVTVAALFAVALLLPGTRTLFHDLRAADSSVLHLAYHVGFQIPLGTVLLEELAFRGVLPAAFGADFVRWRWPPVIIASVLFGIWHLLSSAQVTGNAGVSGAVGDDQWLIALLAVLATAVAGVVLCWWRWVGRGLLTSVIVHLATNSLGFAIAWSVLH